VYVRPNRAAVGAAHFDCANISLAGLLAYELEDVKEYTFEVCVDSKGRISFHPHRLYGLASSHLTSHAPHGWQVSVFAECVRAMLWRDFGLDVLRSLTEHFAERLAEAVEEIDRKDQAQPQAQDEPAAEGANAKDKETEAAAVAVAAAAAAAGVGETPDDKTKEKPKYAPPRPIVVEGSPLTPAPCPLGRSKWLCGRSCWRRTATLTGATRRRAICATRMPRT
jgi:hypothetical protein